MQNIKNSSQNLLSNKLKSIGVYPIDIMISGATGSGKSSTINALSKSYISKVGNSVNPETMEVSSFRLSEDLRFWDTPGLGDGVEKDEIHREKVIELLSEDYYVDDKQYGFIDVVVIVLDGGNRDMGTVYKLLNETVIPNFPSDRIIIAINQADMAMKSNYWNKETNEPECELINFLEDKAYSILNRISEATNIFIKKPIYYSAEYGYNIDVLLESIIDCLPNEKRKF